MLNLCMNTLSGSVLRLSDHHGNETVKINTFFKPLFNKGHEEQCILFHSYVQYIHFSPVQPQSDRMDSEKLEVLGPLVVIRRGSIVLTQIYPSQTLKTDVAESEILSFLVHAFFLKT